MYDLYHYVGTDLSASPSGDMLPVTGTERRKQKVLRRLISPKGALIFHPEYGAGLGEKIGETINFNEWSALILGQMKLEDCVARSPEPTVNLRIIDNGVNVYVKYTDAVSGTAEFLNFDITR
ncbi:hypothetical protein PUATCC27989T_00519 [Phytobacter ursingii]|nr:hypothetical protein PUATCC27989T_00519 [Phytobacter ursingii]